MKAAHRFDYVRFSEGFIERGLIDRETLNHVLQQCHATRALLPEVLVGESLVSDWEVSRVACELYHLPFLTVDVYPPNKDVLGQFDPNFLRQFAVIPLDLWGDLLTVVMPGLVPSDVLEGLRVRPGLKLFPVVGSVVSNRRWLSEVLPAPVGAPEPSGAPLPSLPSDATMSSGPASDDDWLNIFDAGDEAVQLDLKTPPRPPGQHG